MNKKCLAYNYRNIAMFDKIYILIILLFVTGNKGWQAIPANQAMYSARRQGLELIVETNVIGDEFLPRTAIHSTYKFGWCAPGASASVYLHKSALIHFPSWQSAQADYVYLLEYKHTQRYRLQCVTLRIMVPRRYLFRRSRLPLYYCQGTILYVMFDFIQKLEVHEFYLHSALNMPADLHIDFYHPEPL